MVLATTMSKVSLMDSFFSLVAVTLTERLPTSGSPGLPRKVRLPPSRWSQPGSGVPSARVAV